jgi:polyisoprenoid-binding protein YceI
MTVGGGFEVRTSDLVGTLVLAGARPMALGGDLVVDLKTLETGIGLRNTHLRDSYLEVGKGEGFQKAVLSNLKLGDVDPATFQGRAAFTGDLALHGTKVAVKGEAEIRREGSSLRVNATFPVRISEYGIAKPQYLGVGVRDEVQVKVTLVLNAASGAEGAIR